MCCKLYCNGLPLKVVISTTCKNARMQGCRASPGCILRVVMGGHGITLRVVDYTTCKNAIMQSSRGSLGCILRRKIGRLPGDSSMHPPAIPPAGRSEDCQGTPRCIFRTYTGPEDRKIARGLLNASFGHTPDRKIGRLPGDSSVHLPDIPRTGRSEDCRGTPRCILRTCPRTGRSEDCQGTSSGPGYVRRMH